MKRSLLLLGLTGLMMVTFAGFGAGDDEPKPNGEPQANPEKEEPKSFWMKKKLQYSQEILAALANAEFDTIGKQARAMNNLGQIEKWVRANTPEYRTQLRIFRFANEELIQQADDENIDGASLAFVQLTLSCVNCHKVVRNDDSQKAKPADAQKVPPEK